jgi:hypothetical protein
MLGQPLVGYNVSTGVNANIPTGIEIASTVENNTNQGGKAYIDFHTNQKGFVDYDARIMAAGGSTVTPATTQASLNYYAASHYFAGNVNMGTGSNIGLQPATGYITPSAGMLGFSGSVAATTGGLTNSLATEIATSGTLQIGTYVVTGFMNIIGGGTAASTYLWIGDNTITYTSKKVEAQIYLTGGVAWASSITCILSNTVGPFKLVAQSNGAGASVQLGSISYVRIA